MSRYDSHHYRRAIRRTDRRMRGGYPLMIAEFPYEPTAGIVFAIVARFLYRHRSAFAPAWITGTLFAIAAITHAHHRVWWVFTALVTLGTVLVAGVPHRLIWIQRTPGAAGLITRMWEACGIYRTPERIYATVVIACAGSWLSAAIAIGPTVKPLPAFAVFGALILGIPWWAHRRRRARVRIERTVQSWPDLAENMGLPGSRIVSAVGDTWGFTARVLLRKGTPAVDAVRQVPAIESGLGVKRGSVRAIPDPNRADAVIMRVVETDPHEKPIPWPGQPQTSIHQPCALGLFEQGTAVDVSFLRRNVLIGGTTGAGKSGVLNVAIGYLVACIDVEVWGIDLKGGMELQPWAGALTELATTPREATALMANAVAELDRRAGRLAGNARVLEPTLDDPALIVITDEYAELPGDALEHSDSAARRGRAVAITQIAATQKPTQDAMGNTAVRSQMDIRICLRVRERRDGDLILGQGMVNAGWQPHMLAKPGEFLISAPEYQTPERARAYLITDDQIARQAGMFPAPRAATPAEPGTASNGPPRWPQNPGWTPQGTDTGPDPDQALWHALSAAGPDGVSVAELLDVTGMSRPTLYRRLQALSAAGQVIQTMRGSWRATEGR